MDTGNIIGFFAIGTTMLVYIIIFAMTWGRLYQKLIDLTEQVSRQNGRVGKIEEESNLYHRETEHRLSRGEAERISLNNRLDRMDKK